MQRLMCLCESGVSRLMLAIGRMRKKLEDREDVGLLSMRRRQLFIMQSFPGDAECPLHPDASQGGENESGARG